MQVEVRSLRRAFEKWRESNNRPICKFIAPVPQGVLIEVSVGPATTQVREAHFTVIPPPNAFEIVVPLPVRVFLEQAAYSSRAVKTILEVEGEPLREDQYWLNSEINIQIRNPLAALWREDKRIRSRVIFWKARELTQLEQIGPKVRVIFQAEATGVPVETPQQKMTAPIDKSTKAERRRERRLKRHAKRGKHEHRDETTAESNQSGDLVEG